MKLTDYRGANLFDELVDAQGAIRPYYRGVADKLAGLGPEEGAGITATRPRSAAPTGDPGTARCA